MDFQQYLPSFIYRGIAQEIEHLNQEASSESLSFFPLCKLSNLECAADILGKSNIMHQVKNMVIITLDALA